MPFESPDAAAAPTRRSSRLRTAAVTAAAVGTTASASAEMVPAASPAEIVPPAAGPTSRRAARERLNELLASSGTADSVVDQSIAADVAAPVLETHADNASEPVREVAPPTAPTASMPASTGDAFVRAAQIFGTSECAFEVPVAASAPSADERHSDEPAPAHVAPRRRTPLRKVVAVGATVGVMGIAGLLAVSMTMPAEAMAAAGSQSVAGVSLVAASESADAADEEIQAFVASSDVENVSLERSDQFSTMSLVDLASEQGIKFSDTVFTNDPEAAIQWPFMVGVGMSSGYGPRWGTMHQGIDFVPGEGAPIQAIAAGTVRIATEQGGGYGVTVYIDHVIDGQVITSHYSHMQYGSLQVQAGDTVEVGDIVGHTGNTGHSFGAHLHFEIIINGATIDPLPWLQANAGRYTLD